MRYRYRNVAFLLELLINILVFCVSCAILVGLFGRASDISRGAKTESLAAAQAEALVESLRAGGAAHAGTAVYGYGGDWQPTAGANPANTISVSVTAEDRRYGTLVTYVAVASGRDGEELYRLETKHYLPGAVGGDAA